ncbi:MAG: serine hydrolase [Bryobacterales bacterium]|nr:serine hydrolase [Bryobacterales bacterium]
MRFFWLFLLAARLCGADLAGFDAVAEQGLREWKVPGVAVGVIQDGKIVFAKGYGLRERDSNLPVTPRTLFAMGSVSKSFTSAVAATLVDEGKLQWDAPVRSYLPWFRMYDPVATELITMRDLLTHRSGLPGHNFIRFSTYLSREELVRRIAYLEPSHTFRDVYQYNNLMYVTAGYLEGILAGSTWEELVHDRLFVPLGMSRSNTSTLDTQKSDDFARPHNASKELPFYVYQKFGVGPNGAVNSCVEDMLKYLQFYLDNGEAGGRRLISKRQMAELWKPVTVANPKATYALGWQVGTYRGNFRISHGGAITGFRAFMALFPDKRTGIVAMINSEESLAEALADTLADRILGLPPEEHLAALRRPKPAPPASQAVPHIPAGVEGKYTHPAYGEIEVVREGDEYGVKFDALSIGLEGASFLLNEKGQVLELHLPLEQAVKPFVFVKVTP